MLKTSALLIATVAYTNAAQLTWSGRKMAFTDESLWQGSSPFSNPPPASSAFGSAGSSLVVGVSAGTYDTGKILLNGNTKLILGDGSSKVRLNLAKGNGGAGTFAPADMTDTTGPVAGAFDYNCNLNWKNDDGSTPLSPPCVNDDAIFPTDGSSYFVSTFNKKAGAKTLKTQTAPVVTINQCQSSTSFAIGDMVTMQILGCNSKFYFKGKPLPSSWKSNVCPTTSCPADLETTDGNGKTVYMYTSGPYAGKGYLVNNKKLSAFDLENKTDADGNPFYQYGNIKVAPNGVQITSTTVTTVTTTVAGGDSDTSKGGSGDDDSASGLTTIIAIVAVVALLIIVGIIVLVVVVMKRSKGGASDERNVVSFENPMYDNVEDKVNIEAERDDGLYDDPEMADGGTDGYMDVPAGNENNDGGGSGYMDVAPTDDTYEDDDDEDDMEDI